MENYQANPIRPFIPDLEVAPSAERTPISPQISEGNQTINALARQTLPAPQEHEIRENLSPPIKASVTPPSLEQATAVASAAKAVLPRPDIEKPALVTFTDRIAVRREASDGAGDDEAIAKATAEESNAADECLTADRKLTEKLNKAEKPQGKNPLVKPFFKLAEAVTTPSAIGDKKAKVVDQTLRTILANPRELDPDGKVLQFESTPINFAGEAQKKLEGIYCRSTAQQTDQQKATRQAILLCTGSHRSFEHYAVPMVQSLTEMGHDVMVFNPEGFGNSQGQPSEQGIYRSAEAAFKTVEVLAQTIGGIDQENVKVMGYSLGGAAAAHLGTRFNVDVVLERTFDTSQSAAATKLEDSSIVLQKAAQFVMKRVNTFDNASRLTELKGRVLIVTGKDDEGMKAGSERLNAAAQQHFGNPDMNSNYAKMDVGAEHFHDPIGFRIRSNTEVTSNLSASVGSEDRFKKQYPTSDKTNATLWYTTGTKTGSLADQRNTLDQWLRAPPKSKSEAEAAPP